MVGTALPERIETTLKRRKEMTRVEVLPMRKTGCPLSLGNKLDKEVKPT